MSIVVRYDGAEFVCDTPEEARELLAALKGTMPLSPPAGSSTPPAARAARPAPKRKQPAVRQVADSTYLRYGWRIVQSLLSDDSAVGKLSITLLREQDLNASSTGRIILRRLADERPTFLHMHEGARGVSPFVRLTDREAAKNFADAQEQLYKERLTKELGKV